MWSPDSSIVDWHRTIVSAPVFETVSFAYEQFAVYFAARLQCVGVLALPKYRDKFCKYDNGLCIKQQKKLMESPLAAKFKRFPFK